MTIIETEDLSREFIVRRKTGRFSRTKQVVAAVDRISCTVSEGESVGYIGANGAGKSTTIKMITGILVPSSGRVTTCGLHPVEQRKALARQIGVVFGQRTQLWWDLPLRESFTILGAIHRLGRQAASDRIDQLIAELDLEGFLDTPVRQLSLGQRMRGEVAAALVHRPRLLILDEPTIGLDMISKERLRQFLLTERAERGTTLLLTTHDMGDIERLCERVLVVDRGRIVHDGPLAELRRTVALDRTVVIDYADPQPPHDIADTERVGYEVDGLRQSYRFHPERTTAAKVLAEASRLGEVRDLTLREPAIEDIVRTLYGRAR
ncbi:MAG TPA: ATP-binding cassette domain-containing protein [Candidatus Avipropionibacterium avicola]|uniref:ATP-binding cassette domain-containing protein n=1 Tax=Candidatus Avipropionibacterium avicola TaxID=2840701 RepID=A0A9D1GVZ3_9ACTN|nr:ATP-binding cassette domain-containing protein [Candidatus Avipropionibacterium avicola]